MSEAISPERTAGELPARADESQQGGRYASGVGGLATYYRLRSLALEATVATLQSELDRKDRQRQQLVTRYEEILQDRDSVRAVAHTD